MNNPSPGIAPILQVRDPGGDRWLLRPAALTTGYRIRARLRLTEPPAGSTDSAVDLLFDAADPATCYAVRFRELTGVRYLALLRREGGRTRVLAESITAYSFEHPHEVEVTVDGARLEVRLDGVVVARANDVRRLRHDAVGLAATGGRGEIEALQVTELHDDPLPAVPVADPPVPVNRPGLVSTPGPRIENASYRIDVTTQTWTTGHEVTARLSARDAAGSFVEVGAGEWFLLTGEYGDRGDLYASLTRRRVSFTEVELVDAQTISLRDREVSVTWSLAAPHPQATVRVVAEADGHHVVVHHAGGPLDPDEVREVLCGPLQHARMVRDTELLGAAELTAPVALVQTGLAGDTWTIGTAVPPEHLCFADEQNRDPDDQPFGMSLRRPDGRVQPTVVLPQYGRRAMLRAGQEATHSILVHARPVPLFEAYRALAREEYGYRAYRSNVFGQSLTDTMYHLIDLLATGPDEDDAVEYRPSPSGWWGRAKGFIDIENDQAVRTTTTAVLLSAAYLTDDLQLYDDRARPLIEYHLSRNGYGWTPAPGHTVYGEAGRHELCATPFGVTALGALHEMTRRRNPAIARLALSDPGTAQDYWLQRAPMSAPLAAYRLTGDAEQLAEARRRADTYLAEQVDRAYTEDVSPHDFAIYYARDWIGLLELYDETADRRYLDGAYREACRFVTQVFVRPVHDGETTVPDKTQYHDRQIDLTGWWDPAALYDYPVTEITPEPAPRWMLSLTGMSFEALQTYRYSGPTFNPAWAPHLLRLASHTGDSLLRDVAHNAVIGRFTSYPGYYLRQHTVAPLKPDFPLTGPFDNSTLYYHHAPAQLGLTIDYLLTEHETRSGGQVRFPAAFEENFVWFRFRTYGHRPGVFYGDEDVWLWMPRGVVTLDNPQINWISAERGDRFYLSLTSSAPGRESVRIELGAALRLDGDERPVRIIENGRVRETTMTGRSLTVDVDGHGTTAVVVDGAGPFAVTTHRGAGARPDDEATDGAATYHFDDRTPVGAVRGMLLARPDGSGWDAYVQSTCAAPATLRYSVDGGRTWTERTKAAHPSEWTVRLTPPENTFRYQVRSGPSSTEPVEIAGPDAPGAPDA